MSPKQDTSVLVKRVRQIVSEGGVRARSGATCGQAKVSRGWVTKSGMERHEEGPPLSPTPHAGLNFLLYEATDLWQLVVTECPETA